MKNILLVGLVVVIVVAGAFWGWQYFKNLPAQTEISTPTPPNTATNTVASGKAIYAIVYEGNGVGPIKTRVVSIDSVTKNVRTLYERSDTTFPTATGYNSATKEVLFKKDNRIIARKPTGEEHVMLDTAPLLNKDWRLDSFAPPRNNLLIFSVRTGDVASRLYRFEIGSSTDPVVIFDSQKKGVVDYVPYILTSTNDVVVGRAAPVGCGMSDVLITPEGKVADVKFPSANYLSPTMDTDGRYVLTGTNAKGGPIELGMCESYIANGTIELFDFNDRILKIIETDPKKDFTPIALSLHGKLALYGVTTLSWTTTSTGEAQNISRQADGYTIVNTETMEKQSFKDLDSLIQFMKAGSLADDLFFSIKNNGTIYWNGTELMKYDAANPNIPVPRFLDVIGAR